MTIQRNFMLTLVVVVMMWSAMASGQSVEVTGDLEIVNPSQGVLGRLYFGDGSWQERAAIKGVTGTQGITSSVTSGHVTLGINTTSVIQGRVTGVCTGTSYVQSITQAGDVVCGTGSGGTVTSVGVGNGLLASPTNPITSSGALSVSYGGSGGSYGSATSVARSDHSHDTAYYSKAYVDALVARIAALEAKLAKVTVSADTNNIYIDGANLHVRNGSGSTYNTMNSLGNIIIGYNEGRASGSEKTGSHNLVVGRSHNYTSSEGIVAGYWNTISAPGAVVAGGLHNTASGYHSSVTGGANGTASGFASSVSGGGYNEASGEYSFVGGGGSTTAGEANKAFANYSAVLGGFQNQAGDVIGGDHKTGAHSTVSGGSYNIARGNASTVSGGTQNTAKQYGASVSGGSLNDAAGSYASVSGGWGNTASGQNASVSGGSDNTASGESASVSGGGANIASQHESSVSGGSTNTASGYHSSVSGGYVGTASGSSSSVSGGSTNTASGDRSSVSGGYYKTASGDYSCASCLP